MALVGRYETYEQLGVGSTGTVYRARDGILGREVALRILNEYARVSSRLVKSFSATGQVPPEWLHPNIAVIYDLGHSQVGEFVATELLAGADMRSYIRDRCSLSLLQKLDLLAQAANGLAHAHQNRIIHGAIRPASFFIDERQHVKILDIGIRYMDLPEEVVNQNPALIDYCSPEQLHNSVPDARSDVFSAGLVFFEFLVCSHPFRDSNIPNRIKNDAPDSLLRYDPSLPHALDTLLSRALAKNPSDRIQSMQELAAGFRLIESQLLTNTPARIAVVDQTPPTVAAMAQPPATVNKKRDWSSFPVKLTATAAFAFCLILAAYLFNLKKQIENGQTVAEAAVHSRSASLMESPRPDSPTVATLVHGAHVEILDRAPSSTDRFVRAQTVSEDHAKTGYIAAADLSDWRSDNPHVAWKLLLFSQPQKSAAPDELRDYLSALGGYMDKFPDANEVGEAREKQQEVGEWLAPTAPVRTAALIPPSAPQPAALQQPSPDNAEHETAIA